DPARAAGLVREALARETDPTAREALLTALAYLAGRAPMEEVVDPLQAWAGRADSRVELRSLAAGGLVRRALRQRLEDEALRTAIAQVLADLRKRLPGPEAVLHALIAAGADNNVWDAYHERVAEALAQWVQADWEQHFPLLVEALEATLASGADWPRPRILLAGLVTVAQARPASYARDADPARLERLFKQAAGHTESFSTRRFALQAWARLRRVGPDFVQALLRALADVAPVHMDAREAVRAVRAFDRDPVTALEPWVQDARPLTAVTAAQLLTTVARAQAQPDAARATLVAALEPWLQAPYRPWVDGWEKDELRALGFLDDLLYQALRELVGAS
ncbi:MAG: hypothetical protein GXO36_04845, partial [Chloroflexi bacterium]|nr:hypothetical protein [Chloroflexota bacterium]